MFQWTFIGSANWEAKDSAVPRWHWSGQNFNSFVDNTIVWFLIFYFILFYFCLWQASTNNVWLTSSISPFLLVVLSTPISSLPPLLSQTLFLLLSPSLLIQAQVLKFQVSFIGIHLHSLGLVRLSPMCSLTGLTKSNDCVWKRCGTPQRKTGINMFISIQKKDE